MMKEIKSNMVTDRIPGLISVIIPAYNAEKALQIAQLPSREELLGKIIGSMKNPISKFVYALKFNTDKFVYILKAKSKEVKS